MNSEGGEWMSDLTDMKPELHERKWVDIDTLELTFDNAGQHFFQFRVDVYKRQI